MRITLLHNPRAGDERFSRRRLEEGIRAAGHELVASAASDSRAAASIVRRSTDLVVAAGGDGTVAEVVCRVAGLGVPLAILPLGTANNLARSLGVIGSTAELIASWTGSARRTIDVGRASAAGREEWFVEAVGVGVFADLMRRGRSEVKDGGGDWTGNATHQGRQLLVDVIDKAVAQPFRLEIDGRRFDGEYLAIEVMNNPLVGPGLPLAPKAELDDGLLDIVLVGTAERADLLQAVHARMRGESTPIELPAVRGRRLRVDCDPRELHIDGALWTDAEQLEARLPLSIELRPAAVDVIVP